MSIFSREKDEAKAEVVAKAAKPVKNKVARGAISTFYRKGVVLYLVSALSLGAAITTTHLVNQTQLAETIDAAAKIASDSMALQMASQVQERLFLLEQLAKDPAFIQSLPSAWVLVQDYTRELKAHFPRAEKVLLFSPEIATRDPEPVYGLDYSTVELVRSATRSNVAHIEMHQIGKPDQQIAMAAAIHLDNQPVVGYLMVYFPSKILTDQFSKLNPSNAYFELQQVAGGNAVSIASTGDAGLKVDAVPRILSVSDTSWQVGFWAQPKNEHLLLLLSGVAVLLLSLMAGVYFWICRGLSSSLRDDYASMLGMVRDMLAGRVNRGTATVKLSDSLGAFEMLDRMSRDKSLRASQTDMAATSSNAQSPTADFADGLSFEAESFFDEGDDLASDGSAAFNADANVVVKPEIFKAYDIRGVVADALTAQVVYLIGRAFGSQAAAQGQDTVVVGRDGRLSGPDLSAALIAGLRDSGRNVKNIGLVPTPVLYFATHLLNTGTGIIVTGSHNPPDYNGLKMMLAGNTLAGDDVQAIRRRVESRDFISGQGSLEDVSVTEQYIERIAADVHLPQSKKVVVDCGNGAAGEILPRLLRKLGCEVIELFCEIDGTFPNHHPDPSRPENLQDVIKAVREHKADIGLAFDGDGDRVGVITPDGKIIWPDRLMMLLSMDVLERNPGALIIYDVKCSRHLAKIISEYGGIPLMWNTGHSLIKAKMKETGALLAGEMSGHIFFKERWFGFDDGLYVASRLLEVLSKDHRDAASVFSFLPDSFNTPELSIKFPREGQQFQFMQKLMEIANFPGAQVTTIDGLRVDFEDGWGLVRASNTMPSLVLRFEGDTQESFQRIQDDFRALLNAVDANLSLPF